MVAISITFNHGHEKIDSSANFTFIKHPMIKDITPAYVIANQRSHVRLTGDNLSNLSNGVALCSFGDFKIEAVVVNENLIMFLSPLFEERVTSPIKVSLNGVDFTRSGPIFSIFPSPVITSTLPNFSNEDGGVPISTGGYGFYNVPNLSCIFKFNISDHVMVLAEYNSFSSVMCTTPPITNTFREDVDLELSLTGLSFDNNPLYCALVLHNHLSTQNLA